jgi:hypothetical protein
VTAYLSWRAAGDREFADLDEFLLARAITGLRNPGGLAAGT